MVVISTPFLWIKLQVVAVKQLAAKDGRVAIEDLSDWMQTETTPLARRVKALQGVGQCG